MGRPRCTSNCEYMPSLARFRISVERSVPTISIFQPFSCAALSDRIMASE